MAYKITRGELGWDILKDGHIFSIGYGSRDAARRAITADEKQEEARAAAVVEVRKLRVVLSEDYGLPEDEIAAIFKQASMA